MAKRSKRSRLRGKRSCGYGARKKHRGKGSQRGHGMAGTGKMAGQRKLTVLKEMPGYLGKHGFKSRKKKLEIINIGDIERKFKDKEIKLKGFKVLSKGKITKSIIIHANSFSKKAKEKINASGGKAIELKKIKQKPQQEKKKTEKKKENKKE
jgi:large subunit ribosomal protein L15